MDGASSKHTIYGGEVRTSARKSALLVPCDFITAFITNPRIDWSCRCIKRMAWDSPGYSKYHVPEDYMS